MPFKQFVSLCGYPNKIIFDCGTKLVAASKGLGGIIKNLNQEQLKEYGTEVGMECIFTTIEEPWKNRCSESLIKLTKKFISSVQLANRF